jgi:hypothetical protein
VKCSTPLTCPVAEAMAQIDKFLKVKSEGAAVVPDNGNTNTDRIR